MHSTNSSNGWNKEKATEEQWDVFLKDTRGIDTVALKMVFYLVITGVILLLVTVSWGNVSPFFDKVRTNEQVKDTAVELLSIQNGYARNLRDGSAIQGSTCNVELSLPENIRYMALGVDPDPDSDGNLTNSEWIIENSTILIQHRNGEKNRFTINDENIQFRKGIINQDGNWDMNYSNSYDASGLVIEEPINGEFIFELVYDSNGKYTLSHF